MNKENCYRLSTRAVIASVMLVISQCAWSSTTSTVESNNSPGKPVFSTKAEKSTISKMEKLLRSKNMLIFPDLAGKVALVTGSSGEIGSETARWLAANKVKVVIHGRNQDAVNKIVSEIKMSGLEAAGYTADCTQFDDLEKMRKNIENTFGRVDLLFAFAGGSAESDPIEKLSLDRWNKIINQNLTSKFLTIKSFLPSMKKTGKGSIILMSSSAGRAPGGSPLDYSAAQAGVIMLTQQLAQQLGKEGIRVNAIAPCTIHTEKLNEEMTEEEQRIQGNTYSIPRLGKPSDVAVAALFLSSEVASSWITGTILDVNGGGMK